MRGFVFFALACIAFAVGAEELQVDRYGQKIGEEWPGRIQSDGQLREEAAKEEPRLGSGAFDPSVYDRFGGVPAAGTFEATGFFRLQKIDGRWWFITPEGHRYFMIGCDTVDYHEGGYSTPLKNPDGSDRSEFTELPDSAAFAGEFGAFARPRRVNFLAANLQRKYGSDFRSRAHEVNRKRLIDWGFNSTSKWGWGYHIGLPFIEDWNFRTVARFRNYLRTLDVYDPDFFRNAEEEVRRHVAMRRNEPLLLGYATENENGWSFKMLNEAAAGKRTPMKEKLIAFLVEELGAEKTALLWNAPGTSPEKLADVTVSAVTIPRPQAAEFIRRTSRYYHRTMRELYRKYDPDHLWFGASHCTHQSYEWIFEAIPYVDALMINEYDIHGGWSEPIREELRRQDKPFFITEFSFVQARRGYPDYSCNNTVQEESSRGLGYRYYTEKLATDPGCVGFCYFMFYDQPVTRRAVPGGEAYNFGLVNQQDQPYEAMIGEVVKANRELTAVHAGTRSPFQEVAPARILGWAETPLMTLPVLPESRSPYIVGDTVMGNAFFGGCNYRLKVNDSAAVEFADGKKRGESIYFPIGTLDAGAGKVFQNSEAVVHLWKRWRGRDLNRYFRLESSADNRVFQPVPVRFRLERELEHDRYRMTPAASLPVDCRYLRLSIGVDVPEQPWAAVVADWSTN